jgi:hypothetical protein
LRVRVIHVSPAISAYPIYPKTGHFGQSWVYEYTPLGAAQGAQERGEVCQDGQRGKPLENSIPRTTDIGLTSKLVHEVLQIPEKVVRRPHLKRW